MGIPTKTATIRLGLLEDDDLLRSALSKSLKASDIEIVLAAKKPAEFLSLWRTKQIEVALLDCHLGEGPDGIDVARKLRLEDKSIGIVFLTSFEDPRMLPGSNGELPNGSRYLNKRNSHSIEIIADAIRQAAQEPLSPISGHISPFHNISNSHLETLKYVAQGLSNAEIAKRKFLSEKTIESHIRKISDELNLVIPIGMNSRVHIARVYLRALGLPADL